MTRLASLGALLALALPLLAACGEEKPAALPPPQEPDASAVAEFCGMPVLEHAGPKGQIFLASRTSPLWFSSVRDAIAFTLLPEEPKDILAIYVNDMGPGSWQVPKSGAWIEARAAWYVIESREAGGMTGAEAVPFRGREAAARFAADHGGRVVAFDGIPSAYILESASAERQQAEAMPAAAEAHDSGHAHDGHGSQP
jgi:copper chaperone NosL